MAFEILSNFVEDKIQPNLFTPRAFEGFRFEQKSKEQRGKDTQNKTSAPIMMKTNMPISGERKEKKKKRMLNQNKTHRHFKI